MAPNTTTGTWNPNSTSLTHFLPSAAWEGKHTAYLDCTQRQHLLFFTDMKRSVSGGRNSWFLRCQNLESRMYPGKKTVRPGSVTWITLYHELQLFRLLYKDDRVVLIPRNGSLRDIKDSRQQQLRYCCIHKAYTAGGRQAAIFSWFQKPFQSCTSEGPLFSDLLTAWVPFQAGV